MILIGSNPADLIVGEITSAKNSFSSVSSSIQGRLSTISLISLSLDSLEELLPIISSSWSIKLFVEVLNISTTTLSD